MDILLARSTAAEECGGRMMRQMDGRSGVLLKMEVGPTVT